MEVRLESRFDVGQAVYYADQFERLEKTQIEFVKFTVFPDQEVQETYCIKGVRKEVDKTSLFESPLEYRRARLEEAQVQYEIERRALQHR